MPAWAGIPPQCDQCGDWVGMIDPESRMPAAAGLGSVIAVELDDEVQAVTASRAAALTASAGPNRRPCAAHPPPPRSMDMPTMMLDTTGCSVALDR
jgi:hypothetical protein